MNEFPYSRITKKTHDGSTDIQGCTVDVIQTWKYGGIHIKKTNIKDLRKTNKKNTLTINVDCDRNIF